LISDTGMRLSEACGLLIEDIELEADIPHINITPHLWRRLKTKGRTWLKALTREPLFA